MRESALAREWRGGAGGGEGRRGEGFFSRHAAAEGDGSARKNVESAGNDGDGGPDFYLFACSIPLHFE